MIKMEMIVMLVEIQDRDEGIEAINLMSVVGLRLEDKIDDSDTVKISIYFNSGTPGGYVHLSVVLGEYNNYEDALKVYKALIQLNWVSPGSVQMPLKDEDIDVALEHWKYW